MNYSILDLTERALYDRSLTYAETHSHFPYTSNFGNNNEVRICIQHQDGIILPSKSSLNIIGRVTLKDATGNYLPSNTVRFANNGPLHLFSEARYEIGGTVVDRVRNPGISSTMKGYVTYNENQSNALKIAGWFPTETSTLIDSEGYFNVAIPLSMFLGICEDFRKIFVNVKHELVLIRANSDKNAIIHTDDAADVRIELTKIYWKIPHISVNDAVKLKLMDVISSGRELDIPFRSRELHEYPLLPYTHTFTWPIKTTVERPQLILIGFQTDRKNRISRDCSRFDSCYINNVRVFLNDEIHPYENIDVDFLQNRFATLYEMYTEVQSLFQDKEREPILSPAQFKSIAPIIAIDCSKQNETLKAGPIDIRIELSASRSFPEVTAAYCLILHDRVVRYSPLLNVVRIV